MISCPLPISNFLPSSKVNKEVNKKVNNQIQHTSENRKKHETNSNVVFLKENTYIYIMEQNMRFGPVGNTGKKFWADYVQLLRPIFQCCSRQNDVYIMTLAWRYCEYPSCYGNTGYGVSSSGIQNPINFCRKVKCFRGFFDILEVE